MRSHGKAGYGWNGKVEKGKSTGLKFRAQEGSRSEAARFRRIYIEVSGVAGGARTARMNESVFRRCFLRPSAKGHMFAGEKGRRCGGPKVHRLPNSFLSSVLFSVIGKEIHPSK